MTELYDPDLLHEDADLDLDPEKLTCWIVWRRSDGILCATLMKRRNWGRHRRWQTKTVRLGMEVAP